MTRPRVTSYSMTSFLSFTSPVSGIDYTNDGMYGREARECGITSRVPCTPEPCTPYIVRYIACKECDEHACRASTNCHWEADEGEGVAKCDEGDDTPRLLLPGEDTNVEDESYGPSETPETYGGGPKVYSGGSETPETYGGGPKVYSGGYKKENPAIAEPYPGTYEGGPKVYGGGSKEEDNPITFEIRPSKLVSKFSKVK